MASMQSAFTRIVCGVPHIKVSFSVSTVQRLSRQFHASGLHDAKVQDYLSGGLVLSELAVYLDIGLPFEKALTKIAQRKYVLSQEFSVAFQEIKSGGTVQSSLSGMSARTDSLPLK